MSIKAIGFDYGGVIGGVGAAGVNFNKQICKILAIDEATYKNLYFSMNHLINTGGVEGWSEFWELFLDKLEKADKFPEVMALNDKVDKQLEVVNMDMIRLIDDLRSSGYKVGLLSNTTLEHGKKMRDAGFDAHFDAFLISADIKLMKPTAGAFTQLIKALGVNANELAFVDDAEKSLSTASEVGFVPILFTNLDHLINQLAELGIQFHGR